MMTGFERYTKKTRRAIFLEEMEQVVPWAELCALIEPHYPKAGNGRRPKELEQADLLFAAVVQSRRPGSGRGAVRLGDIAAVCGD
jgi:hypothetical protein